MLRIDDLDTQFEEYLILHKAHNLDLEMPKQNQHFQLNIV
eukprot:CAMPEP_0114342704 /NCGR_PEP_ID=MMETSP0101-20121206/10008_1 /TAXON_ID=38822 ORGANISM="Pteridomonas danica, Strain PT" /NCGR_SAMPLE_ID=MMETSP0101 /ASSEMBLY_ACC=CAM_ASM_000211 /LENGTH=39 /DNA_ID= /DNA_START= /DNA_END= /DNA_ORIENTATION=